jgi:hypothetical protein
MFNRLLTIGDKVAPKTLFRAKGVMTMDAVDILNQLEDLVENRSRQLFNKAVVNPKEFRTITNRLRESLLQTNAIEILSDIEDLMENRSERRFNSVMVNVEEFYTLTNKLRLSLLGEERPVRSQAEATGPGFIDRAASTAVGYAAARHGIPAAMNCCGCSLGVLVLPVLALIAWLFVHFM